MNTEATPKQTAKPARAPSPLEEGAVRIRSLLFNSPGGVDLPSEQRVARISEVNRSDKARYRIMFLPRVDKFLVRAFNPDVKDEKPTHTFLIPGNWAVAEFAEP